VAKLREIPMMTYEQLEEVIELTYQIHQFDLRGYSRASLKRRMIRLMNLYQLDVLSLKYHLTNDPSFLKIMVIELTVNVTEMFRDPEFFIAIREKVLPYIKTFPRIKVWSAGCSTGEEVYSLAIMLQESQLYQRSFIYGTDLNMQAIDAAKKGIYTLKKVKEYSENYLKFNALGSLSQYYTAMYNAATIQKPIKQNTWFSVHNLVSDGVFNEFHLICCRNVLIYFNQQLQKQVLDLLYQSLAPFGFLCLGSKEVLRNSSIKSKFTVVDAKQNIFQKIE
jgi:chemotaxis protein methyltransferase CheR